jgi:hypothetical protein
MDTREDRIRRRAYEIWEAAGRTGDPEDHWFAAERELTISPTASPQVFRPQMRGLLREGQSCRWRTKMFGDSRREHNRASEYEPTGPTAAAIGRSAASRLSGVAARAETVRDPSPSNRPPTLALDLQDPSWAKGRPIGPMGRLSRPTDGGCPWCAIVSS